VLLIKIRVISNKDEIREFNPKTEIGLNPNERHVHLTFRPSNKDIFRLVETCPKLEEIQLPRSYMATISGSIKMFLDLQKIQVKQGDVWGHRKDLNVYCEKDDQVAA
jgi:hypothetical protein